MKKIISLLMVSVIVMALSGCGGSHSDSSSEGMFGKIPETIKKYDDEKKSLNNGLNESNYKKELSKIDDLKAETIAMLEKEGEALNGKELPVSCNEEELKIETPLTLVYKNVFSHVAAVEFTLDGKIIAAKDIKLEIAPSDLKGREMLNGKKTIVTAYTQIQLELLDKEGNVVKSQAIGNLTAENNGEEAIVKAGTPMDFVGSFPVSDKYINVVSARLIIDPAKGMTSEKMPE